MSEIKIALADDHVMFRKGVISLLSSTGRFKVIADESNGAALIAALEKSSETPDICILDVNMPVLDGHDTLVALKQQYPHLKFLALTMYDYEYVIIKMLRAGANGYLLKDGDPHELATALDHIYRHDFYYTELVSGRLVAMLKKGEERQSVALKPNERRFLELCCTEMSYKEIGNTMNLSARTVEGYRDELFTRLNIHTRIGLAMYALKNGIISI